MTIRILSFTLAAAWIAAARPAHAYDPSDPRGPPPDDPSAWRQLGEREAAPVAPVPEPRPSAGADRSRARSVRGLDCRCVAVPALPDAFGQDEAAQPDQARGGAVDAAPVAGQ